MVRELEELTYYAKMLTKLKNKKYEFYVVSRIIHLLNDKEIQFTTQQLVRKNDGKRYLIDLYFPQFKLGVEIDEAYHLKQEEADRLREREIVDVSGIEIKRIKCDNGSLEQVHQDIDLLIKDIQKKKVAFGFVPYSYKDEYSVTKWKEKGTISISDYAKFRKHVDVLKLFGKNFEVHRPPTSPLSEKMQVWFPKLYDNGKWKNCILDDGTEIRQSKTIGMMDVTKSIKDSVVFAHQKDVLGNVYYVFKGIFKCVSISENEITYQRISEEIRFADYI